MPFLLGETSFVAWASSLSPAFICVNQFTATSSGLLTEMHIQTIADNVTLFVYADNGSDLPGAFLGKSLDTPVIAATNVILLTAPVTIVSGIKYWIGGASKTSLSISDNTTSGVPNLQYLSWTYGSATPDPYGTPSGNLNAQIQISGWSTQQSWNNFESVKVSGASGMSVTEVVR